MKSILLFLGLCGSAFAQEWQTVPTEGACTARSECGAVIINHTLIFMGGRGIRPTEELNLKTNTWTKHEAAPLEIHHFQAVVYKNEVWVLGALTGGYPHETPIANAYIYNPKTHLWRKGPEIPKDRLRGSAGVFVKNNKIYLVSGIIDGHWDGHVTWFDELEPTTGQWTVLTDAPHARDHIYAVESKDKVYLAAGRRSSAKINQVLHITEPTVDVFDFKTMTWRTLPAEMNIPTERAGSSNFIYKNRLYVVGGESKTQATAHNEVEVLDLQTFKWTKNPSLVRGRHAAGAFVHKKTAYIAGGCGNRGGSPELDSVERLQLH